MDDPFPGTDDAERPSPASPELFTLPNHTSNLCPNQNPSPNLFRVPKARLR